MTDDVAIERHAATLAEFTSRGGPIDVGAPTASTNNPRWFHDGRVTEPTDERRALHAEILSEFAARPVLRESQAIVTAGAPGAGKSTIVGQVIGRRGQEKSQWRVVDPDHFKLALLEKMKERGELDQLLPPQVVERMAAGERFELAELSALVHTEAGSLATQARNEALRLGENVVVDGVLSDKEWAVTVGDQLSNAGYDITVVGVEISREGSQASMRHRWREGYLGAERWRTDPRGAESPDHKHRLGGRWVPDGVSDHLFEGGATDSTCREATDALAQSNGSVLRYEQHRVLPGAREPHPEQTFERSQRGGPLMTEQAARGARLAGAGLQGSPLERPGHPTERGHTATAPSRAHRDRPGANRDRHTPGRDR